MTSCASSITNILTHDLIGTLPILQQNVPISVSFTGFSNTLLRLSVFSNDSVRFQLNLSSSNFIINCQATFYSINLVNNTFTNIGGLNTQEAITVFQKDLLIGDYIICLYSNNIATHFGTMMATFSNFVPYVRFNFTCYYGNVLNYTLSFPSVEKPCDKPLYYEIIDGALPEGIQMNHSGVLYGTLPNLDCIPSNDHLSPSANWYTQLDTGEGYPWGRQYRFKVRVTLQQFPPSIKDEKWLIIRIYNNWGLERDNFAANMPYQRQYDVIVEDEPIVLPKTLCPSCISESGLTTSIATSIECVDCLIPPYTDYQMIRIPQGLLIENVLDWYSLNQHETFSDPEITKFQKELSESGLFKMILWKQGILKSVNNTSEFYKNMKFQIDNLGEFLEIKTSIMNIDVHNIARNEEDLDWQYLKNKHDVNKVLPFEFTAWHR